MAGPTSQKNDAIKLTFVAAKPPPSHGIEQVELAAAEESGEYF